MKTINKREFTELVEDSADPCLVIFSRKTCPVCQAVHKILANIVADYQDFNFYNVDVEEEPQLMNKFKLKGVPQVLFFSNGNVIKQFSGLQSEDTYCDEIDQLVD